MVVLLSFIFSIVSGDLCDLELDSGVCLFQGQTVLQPDAYPKGLMGHWSFDDSKVLDSSGYENHAKEDVPVVSGPGGHGTAAKFDGHSYVEIPNSDKLNLSIFTMTFWAFLNIDQSAAQEDETQLRWCPIIQKGKDDLEAEKYHRTPGVFLDRVDRLLRVFVSTNENEKFPMGEHVESNARLPIRRWTHVTVTRTDKRIRLYVNGILDAVNATEGSTEINDDAFYFGNTPVHTEDCHVPLFIDNVKLFNRELWQGEIEGEAAGSLGTIEANYVRLGCINCNFNHAKDSCDDDYHLCDSIEIHSSVYQVARAQGWVNWNSHLWTGDATADIDNDSIGLGICCADLK